MRHHRRREWTPPPPGWREKKLRQYAEWTVLNTLGGPVNWRNPHDTRRKLFGVSIRLAHDRMLESQLILDAVSAAAEQRGFNKSEALRIAIEAVRRVRPEYRPENKSTLTITPSQRAVSQ